MISAEYLSRREANERRDVLVAGDIALSLDHRRRGRRRAFTDGSFETTNGRTNNEFVVVDL